MKYKLAQMDEWQVAQTLVELSLPKRKPGTRYSKEQLETLNTAFQIQPYPTRQDCQLIATLVGLNERQVRFFFQSRRRPKRKR
jgi:hypothetical protein